LIGALATLGDHQFKGLQQELNPAIRLERCQRNDLAASADWIAARRLAGRSIADLPAAFKPGDEATASWLINADYANDWQQFQSTGNLQIMK
jgi:hypothetical protein